MLAYAPRSTTRSGSPRTLLFVAAGHVVAIALVLTARSEFIGKPKADDPDVIFIDPVKPPPPPPPPTPDQAQPRQSPPRTIDRPPVIIPTPGPAVDPIADGPPVTTFDPVIGNAVEPQPLILPDPRPVPAIVRKAARFITRADRVARPTRRRRNALARKRSCACRWLLIPMAWSLRSRRSASPTRRSLRRRGVTSFATGAISRRPRAARQSPRRSSSR